MKKSLIILANGFEEIEAITVIDILRRAKIEVTTAGLTGTVIQGAHHMSLQTETTIEAVLKEDFDAVILPGGEPGTTHLESSDLVAQILERHHVQQKWIAAICAAPRILNQLGFLHERYATSYPSNQPKMTQCIYQELPVVVSDHIITSRGPGTAMLFALTLVEKLHSPQLANALKSAMLVQTPSSMGSS